MWRKISKREALTKLELEFRFLINAESRATCCYLLEKGLLVELS